MVGADMVELPMNADMDTIDLIGGYEQSNIQRDILIFRTTLGQFLQDQLIQEMLSPANPQTLNLLFLGLEDHDKRDPRTVLSLFDKLKEFIPSPELSTLAEQCRKLASRAALDTGPRFEWTDGVLIKALEHGQWLVLENANLCSSSVLDRLNSLLEPNGVLTVNEHRFPDGSSKIIRPHENFRVILTMDPRHGELSRAMRNRCVELFIDKDSEHTYRESESFVRDSSMFRFQLFHHFHWNSLDDASVQALAALCCDSLSFSDIRLLESWYDQAKSGLIDMQPIKMQLLSRVFRSYIQMLNQRPAIILRIWQMYQSVCSRLNLQIDFCSAQVSQGGSDQRQYSANCHFCTIDNPSIEQFYTP